MAEEGRIDLFIRNSIAGMKFYKQFLDRLDQKKKSHERVLRQKFSVGQEAWRDVYMLCVSQSLNSH
jgi:hypothetical protein